jgi:hypothetical protein
MKRIVLPLAIGIIFLIVIAGPKLLLIARYMLVGVQQMSHLYLVAAYPELSSLAIMFSFIIIAFVYLNVVLGVLSLILNGLEAQFGAEELGRLAKPGHFFDFTRYRPNLYFEGGTRQISIPNTTLSYAKRETGNDLLFLHREERFFHYRAVGMTRLVFLII